MDKIIFKVNAGTATTPTYFIIAIVFWLIFLIIIPQLYMLDLSFRPNLPPLLRGGPDDVHTLVHYKHFIFGSETSADKYNYVDNFTPSYYTRVAWPLLMIWDITNDETLKNGATLTKVYHLKKLKS